MRSGGRTEGTLVPFDYEYDRCFLAGCDDRGGVLLWTYPAVCTRQNHFWYQGHASHVMNGAARLEA